MNKWDNTPKRFIFENGSKTLFETNDISEMNNYIRYNYGELEQYNMNETDKYITIYYYGYTLMIKK